MSASSKKKLRKEQNAALLTEKQQKAQKEAKKLKAYTVTFIVAMVLVLSIVVGIVLRSPVNSLLNKNTLAVTIGDHELSTVDLTYFYVDAIDNLYSTYYNAYSSNAYLYMQIMEQLDLSKPLNEQPYKDDKTITWADHFIQTAIDNAKGALVMYDMAMADKDFEVSDDDKSTIDNMVSMKELYADYNSYVSLDRYLSAIYCDGANEDSYREYCTITTVASSYYAKYAESLEYEDKDYREHEKGKYNHYSDFTYSTYYITVEDYLTYLELGKKNDAGKMEYSAEDELKALAEADKDVATLLALNGKSLGAFKNAIVALGINKANEKVKDIKDVTDYTASEDVAYTSITNADIQKWVGNVTRKHGDITSIPVVKYTDEDKDGNKTAETVGYYVVYFDSADQNLMKLQNVRHILVKYTGGKTDSNGNTTYTDEEKKLALKKAEAILEEYNKDKTVENFSKLASEKSEDTGSKEEGGLYEDVYPGQMLTEFNNWLFSKAHNVGDVEIVQTSIGCHIMYYVGEDELTFRDYMIKNELVSEDATAWYEKTVDEAEDAVIGNLSRMEMDLVMR